ncbi:MAG TPA: nicotinate phosphoribosyltransferase [Thermomicrobiales bacterium]
MQQTANDEQSRAIPGGTPGLLPFLLPPSGLLTDFYHVDSAYVSWRSGRNPVATFDLYTRSHPFGNGYLLVAGLALAVRLATEFRYGDDDLAYLRTLRPYDDAFLDELRRLRFIGEVLAIPEGEIAFAHEPLLRITAPLREALVLESGLLHLVGVSTLIATKAARTVQAAAGRPVAEFGYRRAQAPYLAARSAYIGGCASSSFLAATHAFAIPTSGTIPHALVEAFDSEEEAFRAVAETLDHYSLLLDTYDVRRAIHRAAAIARDVQTRLGHRLASVRLDSGDLLADSRYCRAVLDEAGLPDVHILASGDLDEYRIADLVAHDAPIGGFGVGTSLAVGAGSIPHGVEGGALGAVYKLAWDDDETVPIKTAGEKSTWPGKKQVVRIGSFAHDVIQFDDEPIPPNGRALLETVVRGGAIVPGTMPPIEEIRKRAIRTLATLPERFRRLQDADSYPVSHSERLRHIRDAASVARSL